MRRHSDRAYNTNLSAESEIRQILEDRFRLFEGLYDHILIQIW